MSAFWVLVIIYGAQGVTVVDRYWTLEDCTKAGQVWNTTKDYTNRDFKCVPGPAPKRVL